MSSIRGLAPPTICAILSLHPAVAAQQLCDNPVDRLGGRSAIHVGVVEGEDELRRQFEQHRSEFEEVLRQAGLAGRYDDFASAIGVQGFLRSVVVAPRQRFEWMAYRRKADQRVSLLRDACWAGAAGFEAWAVDVPIGGTQRTFLLPEACLNLVLLSGSSEAKAADAGSEVPVAVVGGTGTSRDTPEPVPCCCSEMAGAVAALDRGELRAARAGFERALREAEGCSDRNGRFDALVYLGLVATREADAAEFQEGESRPDLLAALDFYLRALELEPRAGSALNNIAEIYVRLGRNADAESAYAAAASVEGDPLLPFYHRNFGDFLAERHEWRRAAEQYRLTLQDEPDDQPAHEALVAILRQHVPAALPAHLWFLIQRGRTVRAEETAAATLPGATDPATARALLVVLAAALAEQSYPPERFAEERPDTVKVLQEVTTRSDVGREAQTLLDLHAREAFAPEHYRWWLETAPPAPDARLPAASAGQPPRDVFRSLARSLAERELLAGNVPRAEDYFVLAVALDPRTPDPLAVRGLAEAAARTGEAGKLDVAAASTEELLRGVPRGDLYAYRHDLGILYSWLERWEISEDGEEAPSAALFQLSRAAELADAGADELVDSGAQRASGFDARVYSYLTEGYVAVEDEGRANEAWLGLVHAYERRGHRAEAANLLAIFDPRRRRPVPSPTQRDPFDDPPYLPPHPGTEDPKPPDSRP